MARRIVGVTVRSVVDGYAQCVSNPQDCCVAEGVGSPVHSLPTTVEPGETLTLDIPVSSVLTGAPPSIVQLVLEVPDGLDTLEVILIAPDGVTQYQLIENPASNSPQLQVLLLPGVAIGGPIQSVVTSDDVAGQFQVPDDFGGFGGDPNGNWQLQVVNEGEEQIQLQEVRLVFGQFVMDPDNAAQFQIDAQEGTTSDQYQVQVDAFPDLYLYQVDWGDGNVDWFQFQIDPNFPLQDQLQVLTPAHTYSSSGDFTIEVTAYDRNGASTLKTIDIDVAPFSGNECSSAVVLTPGFGSNDTVDPGDEWWVTFTVPPATQYTVAASHTGLSTISWQVYSGSCGALVPVAGPFLFDSPHIITPGAGGVYYAVATNTGGVPDNYNFVLNSP